MSAADHMDWARGRVARILEEGPQLRVVAVLIASMDFVAAVDGRTVGLSSDVDRALLRAWREVADVLLVGSRTLMAELYAGSMLPAASRERRVGAGLAPVPTLVTIDRSGSLDLDIALRGRDAPPLTVYVPEDGRARRDARTRWVRLADPTPANVIADLRRRVGARVIVAEGGPRLIQAALAEHTVTDLSLTIAPLLLGDGPRLLSQRWRLGPDSRRLPTEVVDDYVFAHWLIAPADLPGHTARATRPLISPSGHPS